MLRSFCISGCMLFLVGCSSRPWPDVSNIFALYRVQDELRYAPSGLEGKTDIYVRVALVNMRKEKVMFDLHAEHIPLGGYFFLKGENKIYDADSRLTGTDDWSTLDAGHDEFGPNESKVFDLRITVPDPVARRIVEKPELFELGLLFYGVTIGGTRYEAGGHGYELLAPLCLPKSPSGDDLKKN